MSYATAAELARILQLQAPSAEQTVALQRVLDSATTEIDAFLGRTDGPFQTPYPALVVEVCLERAVDHWKAEQSPLGIVSLGGDAGSGFAARNTFRRHASTLLPLKEGFGVG
jgi:phage gp36-like protein